MNLNDFGLLTDENLHSQVAAFLRGRGFDVLDVKEASLQGTEDTELVRMARVENRVILTHDSDFGTLAVARGEPFVGLVYLRPGHIVTHFVIEMIEQLLAADLDVRPPFIVVVQRSQNLTRIRYRQVDAL